MRFTLFNDHPLARAAAEAERGAGRRHVAEQEAQHVAEIVTFRLVAGADPARFATVAEGMTPFLNRTGAVLSRSLSADTDGLWTDYITWTSLPAAQEAAAVLTQQAEAAPFLAMIDGDTVNLRHAPIHFSMPKE